MVWGIDQLKVKWLCKWLWWKKHDIQKVLLCNRGNILTVNQDEKRVSLRTAVPPQSSNSTCVNCGHKWQVITVVSECFSNSSIVQLSIEIWLKRAIIFPPQRCRHDTSKSVSRTEVYVGSDINCSVSFTILEWPLLVGWSSFMWLYNNGPSTVNMQYQEKRFQAV